jgi:hypothetical protein
MKLWMNACVLGDYMKALTHEWLHMHMTAEALAHC